MTERPTPAARLENPEAVLSRGDLAELGYERRAVDAIFAPARSSRCRAIRGR